MLTVDDKLEHRLNNMMEIIHSEGASKKALLTHSEEFIKELIDSGELNTLDALGKLTKMQDFLGVIEKALRAEAVEELSGTKEPYTSAGVTFQVREGAKRLNGKGDFHLQELEDKVKQRKDLLKIASKDPLPIYDSEGVEVPKVGFTHGADSVTIKY